MRLVGNRCHARRPAMLDHDDDRLLPTALASLGLNTVPPQPWFVAEMFLVDLHDIGQRHGVEICHQAADRAPRLPNSLLPCVSYTCPSMISGFQSASKIAPFGLAGEIVIGINGPCRI